MKMARIAAISVALMAGGVAGTAFAQDATWPGFRGPTGGVIEGDSHPLTWTVSEDGTGENLAWAIEVPGASWSSPLVIGDTVYVVTAVTPEIDRPSKFSGTPGDAVMKPETKASFELHAYKLSSGEQIFAKVVSDKIPDYPTHQSNSFATESPVTDGDHIFMHFGAVGVVAAYDLKGNEVWKTEIGSYTHANEWGTGSSIAYHDGVVIVPTDNEMESFVVGFDAATGDEKWRKDRNNGSSWASPITAVHEGQAQVIIPGNAHVTSYDPATGEELWKATGLTGWFSASPSLYGDSVLFCNRGGLVSIDLSARGEFAADPDDDRVDYVSSGRAGWASPVVIDDTIYFVAGPTLAAYSCETGETIFRDRLPDQGQVISSLWTFDGHIFAINETGTTFVAEAGSEYKLEGTNVIEGDVFSGTPSVADGALLIRGAKKLYCIRADEG